MHRTHLTLFILFLCLSTSTLLYSNCGQPRALKHMSSASLFSSAKPQKVINIASHRQLLPSYMSCLGLADNQIRAETRNAAKESATTLSLEGDANTITAPMMMAVIKVAGEVCLDLITAEQARSQRKFFPGFDLGAPANSQNYDLSMSIQNFAKACWSRPASEGEVSEVTANLSGVNLQNAKNRTAALYLCTTLMSAGESVRR